MLPAKSRAGAFSFNAIGEAMEDSGFVIDTAEKELRSGIVHSSGFSGIPAFYANT
jgi:hypothetical protein